MTRLSTFSVAALFALAGSALLPSSASAQLGNFCGGHAGVGSVLITEGSGHHTMYAVKMINEQIRGMSFMLAFEPVRPTQAKPSPREYMLKPKTSVMVSLGYSVDVKPLTKEEVIRSLRVTNCKVDTGNSASMF